MTITENLLTGIVAGLVAAFSTWFFVQILRKMVQPWYESVLYDGHIISGEWKGYFLAQGQQKPKGFNFSASLDQQGHNIKGDLFLTKQPSGTECEKHFTLKGNFREDDLILNFEAKDKKKFGRGTFVLQLKHDGEVLDGIYTHFEAMHDTVASNISIWERPKNNK
jgi:hypothetical protein